jgi:hypothetical protein
VIHKNDGKLFVNNFNPHKKGYQGVHGIIGKVYLWPFQNTFCFVPGLHVKLEGNQRLTLPHPENGQNAPILCP